MVHDKNTRLILKYRNSGGKNRSDMILFGYYRGRFEFYLGINYICEKNSSEPVYFLEVANLRWRRSDFISQVLCISFSNFIASLYFKLEFLGRTSVSRMGEQLLLCRYRILISFVEEQRTRFLDFSSSSR